MDGEDFVTYEQAVKLKECGFDWLCTCYYKSSISKSRKVFTSRDVSAASCDCDEILCPSLTQVAKWLRKKWNLHVQVAPFSDCIVDADGHEIDRHCCWGFGIIQIPDCSFVTEYGFNEFPTYEAAFYAGIDKALDFIKITVLKEVK